ncbi:hypothetical protein [Streptomyces sp. ST2-7A]|uniref:hypothetical protein n=1 Tax=Streptomyces sp. ST2-7A TaxID=2907214 RepID=UPI001F1A64C0|nr:hypothetical protein [Streptomyces sp. ST2-7A]MCE7081180.1 hypothetical protein [Streptomyces sp. ST2-7A]
MTADLLPLAVPLTLGLALFVGLAVKFLVSARRALRPVSMAWEHTRDTLLLRTREAAVASRPHADHLRIAVMEYELLGIEPEPGTAAAAAVGFHRFANQLKEAPDGNR